MSELRHLLVYIAGPYTAKTGGAIQRNVDAAIDAGIAVFRKGHFPYIPHLTHYVELRAKQTGIELLWADFMRWDQPWLESSDALLFMGSSPGADLELKMAKDLAKEVFYSIDEVPAVGLKSSTVQRNLSPRHHA